ncbi:hypothetical protein Tco_0951500 [Tanacetum coccineum]|uniref:Reverse transcriptase Ty1/copia-type domain-containing protein n=1 Tax=Tanacetum coccineum TaxID=301880 RepID=A0ABQ5DUA8_9ASTR
MSALKHLTLSKGIYEGSNPNCQTGMKHLNLCANASDFALGAVLGQRSMRNHFRPIHMPSKTMNEAESRGFHDILWLDSMVPNVWNIQEKFSQRDEMPPKIPSKFVKSLTSRALTLLGPFSSSVKGTDVRKESQKQTKPSTEWKRQSQIKVKRGEKKRVNETQCRGMIGSLMYLTASRPDIQFLTCLCARYHAYPKESHLIAVKRIFRYLKGTPSLGLWYPNCSGFDLKGYSDSNYAGCNMDRKGTSAKAKYVAAVGCCANILWMKSQLTDYDIIYKKIYHFIRDHILKWDIELHFIPTQYQLTDIFTKPLDEPTFKRLIVEPGMLNIDSKPKALALPKENRSFSSFIQH